MRRRTTILSPLVLFILVWPSFAQQNVLQQRIERALAGDTLAVASGTHEGNILLDKKLVLLGEGMPIIRGTGKGSCVVITADSCMISGFVIERSGSDLMAENAGILVKSDYNKLMNNDLRDILFGIYLLQADRNEVSDNVIVGRKEIDYGQRGSGIHIWNSHHNRFRGNTVSFARDGFYIQYASHTLIELSTVSNVRYGLHYMYADSNRFLRNRFTDNVAGAAIMYSRQIDFRHNVFARNRGYASYGLLFQDCKRVTADSNVIVDNAVGMFFEASSGNRFYRNIIAQNDVALQMFQNSTGNFFSENNFIDNLNPLSIVGKQTESSWSPERRGNYWSSYDGYDLDNDGIGDVPMKIQNTFQYLEGQYPNLRLYLYSPASQALAVATTAFPIININEERDVAPLMHPVDLSQIPAARLSVPRESNQTTHGINIGWAGVAAFSVGFVGFVFKRVVQRGTI